MDVSENKPGKPGIEQDFIRCFVGISAADMALEDTLAGRIDQWRNHPDMGDIRWTPREFLHLTLAFLGAQPRQALAPLIARLDESLLDCMGIAVSLTHCGGFPDAKSRILAAIPQSTPELLALQQRVAQTVASVGIELESRPYLPHITLGRWGRHSCTPDFVEPLRATGQARAVSLYRSDAVANSSHYTVIARWPLRD